MSGDRGDEEDALTRRIIEAIIRVHSALGPGFLESVYQRAVVVELRRNGIPIASEFNVVIEYAGQPVGQHRLDLVVDGKVIVELKTVDELNKAHYAQVRSYLRATGLSVALLVNFSKEKADFRRVVIE